VVDFWTAANDWATVADPQPYPSIGLGLRFGRQPEVFSVVGANSGLMFTNDTLPGIGYTPIQALLASTNHAYRGAEEMRIRQYQPQTP
jgi:hypothetical protein